MAEYISREEAINAIKSLESSMPAKDNYAKGYDAALGRVLIAVREVPPATDVQPVNQWISVKDRLPDKFDYVLCYCKTTTGEGNVFMYGAYHNDTWWLKTCRTYATLEQPQMRVMYWMPLPEPPQD